MSRYEHIRIRSCLNTVAVLAESQAELEVIESVGGRPRDDLCDPAIHEYVRIFANPPVFVFVDLSIHGCNRIRLM